MIKIALHEKKNDLFHTALNEILMLTYSLAVSTVLTIVHNVNRISDSDWVKNVLEAYSQGTFSAREQFVIMRSTIKIYCAVVMLIVSIIYFLILRSSINRYWKNAGMLKSVGYNVKQIGKYNKILIYVDAAVTIVPAAALYLPITWIVARIAVLDKYAAYAGIGMEYIWWLTPVIYAVICMEVNLAIWYLKRAYLKRTGKSDGYFV